MNATKLDLEKRIEQEKQRDIQKARKGKTGSGKACSRKIESRMKCVKLPRARKDDDRIEKVAEAITETKRIIMTIYRCDRHYWNETLGRCLQIPSRAVSEVLVKN
ncbi:MAG: hypothetical protein IPI77_17205 [Saprospiraceae bacterium]|nr:hypothetical protein [Saprospiraceae bacterium]